MKILQFGKSVFDRKGYGVYAKATAAGWEDVFGTAKDKLESEKTKQNTVDSGYFLPKTTSKGADEKSRVTEDSSKLSVKKEAFSAYAGMNSMNLRIQPKPIEYERYRASNDAEKLQIERKDYDVQKVINPFHHSKTHNLFNDDIREAFKEAYGDWDGQSEDGKGFAYVDKYGYSHVSDNFFTALVYSMDGKVYNYEGKQMGGYAVNAQGERVALLGLDNSVLYGNFKSGDATLRAQLGTNNSLSDQEKQSASLTQIQSSSEDFINYVKWKLFDFSAVSSIKRRNDYN